MPEEPQRIEESPLQQARRHVAEGEQRIAEQRAIVEPLRSDGYDTSDAERLLHTLEQTLEVMLEHLGHEERRGKG